MTGDDNKKKIQLAVDNAKPAGSAPPPPSAKSESKFKMGGAGLFKKSDGGGAGMWVSAPFEVLTEVREPEQGEWGLLLLWRDRDGHPHKEVIRRALFTGEGNELRAILANGGLTLSPFPQARAALVEYLSLIRSPQRAVTVARVGWHITGGRRAFVLPDETIGDAGEKVVLLSPTKGFNFGLGGTLEGWQGAIGARCTGNSRLMLAVSVAFAAPLIDLVGEDGGGVHLYGRSRAGKTTLLRVAGSVCGGNAEAGAGGYTKTWRATGNALEATALAHCDALLPLDEIGQADGKDIGETAYMLGNGQGKQRLDRNAGLKSPIRFRALFLSTGELTLSTKITETGKPVRAGMEARMIDVPAEPGDAGVFEAWPIDGSPAALAAALNKATREHYGHPFRAFLRFLVAEFEKVGVAEFRDDLRGEVETLAASWIAKDADPQVRSVARRFALIGLAGEMAGDADITGWKKGAAQDAAVACFRAWLEARGGKGAREDQQAAEQLRAFITQHGPSRFEEWREPLPGMNDGETLPPAERFRTVNRAGWRRWEAGPDGEPHWRYFLTATGMREVLAGLEFAQALKSLVAAGMILPGKNGVKSEAMNVPGQGKVRLYCVARDVLSGPRDDAPAGA